MKKVGIVSCYFQENYGSMLQAYATQKILDDLGYENENINIDGLKPEINKAKAAYFAKAALTFAEFSGSGSAQHPSVEQCVFQGVLRLRPKTFAPRRRYQNSEWRKKNA